MARETPPLWDRAMKISISLTNSLDGWNGATEGSKQPANNFLNLDHTGAPSVDKRAGRAIT